MMHRLVDIKENEFDKWSSFTAQLQGLLNAAITADGASKGNLQLFNPYLDGLQIVAHHGFDKPFLHQFGIVRWDEPTACGRAYRFGLRVVIPDISVDRFYAPYLSIAHASGYRAVQSTPIIQSGGSVIGVLSTHFSHSHEWSETAQRALDHSASKVAASVLELLRPFTI
jgi:GAF domain-containing protein